MSKNQFVRQTRSSSSRQFGGSACELDLTAPSTFRDVIRYYYFLKKTNQNLPLATIVDTIYEKLLFIWGKINQNLPLMKSKNIKSKLKKVLSETTQASGRRLPPRATTRLTSQLDTLFDISACQCDLPEVPCTDRNIRCTQPNCTVQHIGCLCPADKKVPISDRLYLKDQRQKVGTKGKYQMSSSIELSRARSSHVSIRIFLLP